MKKLSLILAVILVMSLAACGAPAEETSVPTTEAAAVLAVNDLSYVESGAIEDFQINGTITSGEALSHIECSSSAASDALGLEVSDDADPYYFEDGVNSADLAVLEAYFEAEISNVYALFADAAAMLGSEDSVEVKLDVTCYDASGENVSFTINYDLANSEEPAELTLTDIAVPTDGTIDDFQIAGTISSGYALTKVECEGTAKSAALDISVSDTADPFYFPDNTFEYDVSDLTDYFVAQYQSMYDLYADLAGLIGADNTVKTTITVTVYDASGNSENFVMNYDIIPE